MTLMVGDRVKISESSQYYSEDCPSNPRIEGVIVSLERMYIDVVWDNDICNTYRKEDLKVLGFKYKPSSPLGLLLGVKDESK